MNNPETWNKIVKSHKSKSLSLIQWIRVVIINGILSSCVVQPQPEHKPIKYPTREEMNKTPFLPWTPLNVQNLSTIFDQKIGTGSSEYVDDSGMVFPVPN